MSVDSEKKEELIGPYYEKAGELKPFDLTEIIESNKKGLKKLVGPVKFVGLRLYFLNDNDGLQEIYMGAKGFSLEEFMKSNVEEDFDE